MFHCYGGTAATPVNFRQAELHRQISRHGGIFFIFKTSIKLGFFRFFDRIRRDAEVAQWQSNCFVNSRLEVRSLSSAPGIIELRWRSGQSHLSVEQAPFGLRRFESFPQHQTREFKKCKAQNSKLTCVHLL